MPDLKKCTSQQAVRLWAVGIFLNGGDNMKNCTKCKYAEWNKTKTGRLHPSGDGSCTYQYKIPKLPESMHWITKPRPYGGWINRNSELNDHCVYYQEM
jgi:hypothetical protein